MKAPVVSILMPVKNGMPFLEECLQSIKDQALEEWELLAVNDHSTDGSAKLLAAFAGSDPRIRMIDNPGRGISSALSTALAGAAGRYITRMDCDDLMHTDKLRLMSEALYGKRRSVSVSLVHYFSSNSIGEGYKAYETWLNDLTSSAANYTGIYRECVIPSPAWMTSREEATRHGLFESPGHPEDYDLSFRFYSHDFEVVPVNQVLHLWRDHPARTSRTDPSYDIRRFGVFKLKWLLHLELKPGDVLILWGCGKKGKELAGYLKDQEIDFKWVTGNEKKIGHVICDTLVEHPVVIGNFDRPKVIVAVAKPADRSEIEIYLKESALVPANRIFLFS